jgi:hypothetical protein
MVKIMKIELPGIRQFLATFCLLLVIVTTTACSSAVAKNPNTSVIVPNRTEAYSQLERGNSLAGQKFGNWVVQTSQGLVSDSYVRDNNQLGVVISSQVKPTEVKTLAKSLVIGFHKNFPDRDLTVLMYAPDKQKILTAKYNARSEQIEYQA